MPSNSKRPRRSGSPGADPSRVLFVRNILPNTSEMEVQRSFENYGRVRCVFLIPKQHQALVEFSSLEEAEDLLRRQAEGEKIHIRDEPIGLSFSKQSRITDPRKAYLSHEPTDLLLFTLFHVEVQVDCDTFRKICSPYGRLQRVCITKTGPDMQAIVQFSSADEAAAAKPNLNGADIYENCNTLRCEFVKNMVYDILTTNPRSILDDWSAAGGHRKPIGRPEEPRGRPPPAVAPYERERRRSGPHEPDRRRPDLYESDRRRLDAHEFERRGPIGAPPARVPRRPPSPVGGGRPGGANEVMSSLIGLATQLSELRGVDSGAVMQYLAPLHQLAQSGRSRSLSREPEPPQQQQPCLIFISGLSEKLNCDRLFNVLCLYGNVRLIKFFASNKKQAMAEMMDPTSARLCVEFLHHRTLLGRRLVVDFARQNFLKNVENFTTLPDGTPCVKDYSKERSLNRFLTAEKMKKNHPVEPVPVAYFWGAPSDSNDSDMLELMESQGAPKPQKVQFLNTKDQARSGFLHFDSPREALDAICLMNHIDVRRAGRVWLLKLAFSVSNERMGTRRDNGHSGGRERGYKRRRDDY